MMISVEALRKIEYYKRRNLSVLRVKEPSSLHADCFQELTLCYGQCPTGEKGIDCVVFARGIFLQGETPTDVPEGTDAFYICNLIVGCSSIEQSKACESSAHLGEESLCRVAFLAQESLSNATIAPDRVRRKIIDEMEAHYKLTYYKSLGLRIP
jgi:hypothetical protein